MNGYVSPIPTIVALDYTSRVAGQPQERRMHVFKGPNGREIRCNPVACRECYREANWTAGQTRGNGYSAFERDHYRYIVFKRAHLTASQLAALEALANLDGSIPPVSRHHDRWPTVECVVVEHDWPEYEAVWRMIQERVEAAK